MFTAAAFRQILQLLTSKERILLPTEGFEGYKIISSYVVVKKLLVESNMVIE